MKKIILFLSAAGLLLLTVFSCAKQMNGCGAPPPLTLLEAWMTDGPWQLISATRYNASGLISRYKGTPLDTLDFGYSVPGSVAINTNGVYSACQVQWPLADSTIALVATCRPFYGDSLYLNSFGEELVVFKVKFDSANIHGWEVDSLKKMYFWNP